MVDLLIILSIQYITNGISIWNGKILVSWVLCKFEIKYSHSYSAIENKQIRILESRCIFDGITSNFPIMRHAYVICRND